MRTRRAPSSLSLPLPLPLFAASSACCSNKFTTYRLSPYIGADMSKLNANAFSFVPGQGFRLPSQPAAQGPPPPAPIERPAQAEAPAPAPTISLNIGGSKPAPPPAPAPAAPSAPAPTAVKSEAPSASATPVRPQSPVPQSSGTSTPAKAATKTAAKPAAAQGSSANAFTLERAKNDTTAIAQEVQNAVDEATLKDLYGNGTLHCYERIQDSSKAHRCYQ